MLFLYAGTGLTAILALSLLSSDFTYLRLLNIAVLFGLGISWWQEKNNKKIPHLKTLVNALLVILTIRALLPFFTQSQDLLTGLIKTWVYFLFLSTFTIYSKRDHYVIQTLSLGAVIFSCFSQTNKAMVALIYILAFFIIWIIALRTMSLLQDIKEIKDIIKTRGWFYRELKIQATFICIVAIFTLPLYLHLPRLHLPIPFLGRLMEQRYAASYADYPRSDLLSFISSSEQKLTKREGKDKGSALTRHESLQKQIEIDLQQIGQRFHHSPQEYENKIKELEEQIKQLNQNLEKIDRRIRQISQIQSASRITELMRERERLLPLEQELQNSKKQLEKEKAELRESYIGAAKEKSRLSLTEPQNAGLLKELEKKIKSYQEKLEARIDTLRRVNEGLSMTQARIKEVYRQLNETQIGREILNLWSEKEKLEKSLTPLNDQITVLRKDYRQLKIKLTEIEAARIQAEKARLETQEEKSAARRMAIFDLLTQISISLLILIALYFTGRIAASLISFLKERRKIARALKNNYRLFIILIYNFLSKLLAIFGHRRAATVTPREYSIILNRKIGNIQEDINCLTALFLEARYSSHTITSQQAEKARQRYRGILRELRRQASFLKRMFLSFG